jgi:hypothetical protein
MKQGLADAAASLEIEEYPQLPGFLKREEDRADRKRARDAARRRRGKRLVEEWYRTHPCVDCGNSDVRCLEADHVMGERNFTVSENLWRPVRKLEAELELCESRCSNCHKIRHYEERRQAREFFGEELL